MMTAGCWIIRARGWTQLRSLRSSSVPPKPSGPGRWYSNEGTHRPRRRHSGAHQAATEPKIAVDGTGKPKCTQALNFLPPPDSLEDGFYPDEIETRVGCESDQKRRRRLFLHDVHEAFLSKQTALGISKTGSQPCQRVRRERNSGLANVSGRG